MAGSVLAGLWLGTDHMMAYRNENLLQMNPLALGLVLLGGLTLRRRSQSARWQRALPLALAALAVLGFIGQLLPGWDQVNGPIVALALPVHLGVVAGLRRAR
jgi:hypothetical protein